MSAGDFTFVTISVIIEESKTVVCSPLCRICVIHEIQAAISLAKL